MRCRSLFASWLIFSLSFWVASASESATIERYNDPIMGCTLLLSGRIVGGDAQRLENLIQELRREHPMGIVGRICFNSSGGSFVEGVRLAQVIRNEHYMGSAIADRHRCESACAIAFMAGGFTEGGYDSVRPIMHPRARLGFHAPSIDIPTGQYTEMQVAQAWNVALRAVAEIVEMRARPLYLGASYNFSDMLFLEMLSTPPESLFYIDTVAKAARFNIAVYPVGLNSSSPENAMRNLCSFASGWETGGIDLVPIIRRPSVNLVEGYFSEGFLAEAVSPCRAVLDITLLRDIDLYLHSFSRSVTIEGTSGADPFMTFEGSVRLESLPVDIEGTWQEFLARVQVSEPRIQQCWLTSPSARIVNVTEYVNLRRQPEFSAPVIRQVPRREQVRVERADNITFIGQELDRQACISACRAFGSNREDRTVRDRAEQCINDNMLWYQVTDARGNLGWVSRRFLEEVP